MSAPFGVALDVLASDWMTGISMYDITPVVSQPGRYRLRIGDWRLLMLVTEHTVMAYKFVRKDDETYR